MDVWSENKLRGNIDVRFNHVAFSNVIEMFSGIDYEIIIEDVAALAAASMRENERAAAEAALNALPKQPIATDFFKAYRTYPEIMEFLNEMNTTYPSLTRLETIGKTIEGREIVGIHISSPKNQVPGVKKPLIVYNSLQHAREWISGATTTYIINHLLSQYGTDKPVTNILDQVDFFIIPVVNVDGYLHTFAKDRFWRKNRRITGGSCNGVDLNRNWGFQFKADTLSQTCTETYSSNQGFSEPESSALGMFLKSHPETVGYIDFHAYSQLLMWPWAYTSQRPADDHHMSACGEEMSAAAKAVHGYTYEAGQVYTTIYPAYGSSVDYALSVGVDLSYVVELRDTGRYGFLLPPDQIIPTAEEMVAAVEAMANYIIHNNIGHKK